jgi:hypothetical protein
MGLTVLLDTAAASPSSIKSGDTTSISVTGVATAAPTHALAEYVIDAADPVVFGTGAKRTSSALVPVSAIGTSISSRVALRRTSNLTGEVTVTILVSERDSQGNRLSPDSETAVVIEIH